MVSEAGDVQAFLAQHPPFNHLSEDQLEFASANIYVAFSKPGNELQLNNSTGDGPSTGVLIVRSGSLEIRDQQGVLIDRLSSGDYLVPSVLYSDAGNIPRVVVLDAQAQAFRLRSDAALQLVGERPVRATCRQQQSGGGAERQARSLHRGPPGFDLVRLDRRTHGSIPRTTAGQGKDAGTCRRAQAIREPE